MKKKITALCLVVALALVAIGGATMAYFTDKDQQNNTFAIGNIDIKVDEYGYVFDPSANNGKGAKVKDAVTYTAGGMEFTNIMPSYIISKRPYVKNESTRNAAYVRVAVTLNNYTAINNAIDEVYEKKGYTADQVQALYDNIFYGWGLDYSKNPIRGSMAKRADQIGNTLLGIDYVRGVSNQYQSGSNGTEYMETFHYGPAEGRYYENAYTDDGRLYVFYLKLEPGETFWLFNAEGDSNGGLNVPADFNNEQMKMFEGLEIGIYADAIQTVGFSGDNAAKDAFAALEAEHPIGWWNAE